MLKEPLEPVRTADLKSVGDKDGAGRLACPVCGSADTAEAERVDIPRGQMADLCRYRNCESCGVLFEPPPSVRRALGVILLGVIALAMGLVKAATEPGPFGISTPWVSVVVTLVLVPPGTWLIVLGLRCLYGDRRRGVPVDKPVSH